MVLFQFNRVRFAKTLGENGVLEVRIHQFAVEDDVLGRRWLFLVTGSEPCLRETRNRQSKVQDSSGCHGKYLIVSQIDWFELNAPCANLA